MTTTIPPPADDCLLREYAQTQSPAAFSQLAARHVDWIYSAALRLTRDPALAEDVTQGVLLALSQKARTLQHHPLLVSWLFRATHFGASNLLRAERRRKQREVAAMPTLSSESTVNLEWLDIQPRLDAAVARLSAADREAILLRFYQQRTHPDIAATLNISEEAARKRVNRALERLRHLLGVKSAATLTVGLTGSLIVAAPRHLLAASAAPKAVLLSKSIQTAFTLAKFKWAALILLAVLPLPIAVAVVAAHGHLTAAPSATTIVGATVPAAVDSTPPAADFSDIHSYAITSYQSGPDPAVPEHLTGRNYFDLNHGSLDTHIFSGATLISRDDGQHAYRYRVNGPYIVQKNSDQPPALRGRMMMMVLDFYRSRLIQRHPEMDVGKGDETLRCWESAEVVPPSPNRADQNTIYVWLDSRGRARRMQTITFDTVLNTTTLSRGEIEYNAAIPAETWAIPNNVKIVQPEVMLDSRFPLGSALFIRESLGQTFAIHTVQRDANGIVYVVCSTRATAATRKQEGRFLDHYSLSLHLGADADTHVVDLASVEAAGVHVKCIAVVPAQPGQRLAMSAEIGSIDMDREAAPRSDVIAVDLPITEITTEEQFLGDAYAAAQNFDGIATATLYEDLRNKKHKLTCVTRTPAELSKEAYLQASQARLLDPTAP